MTSSRDALRRAWAPLALLVVVASGAPAEAVEPCPGVDLVAKIREDDPAAFARIEKAAAAIPNADGVLWRVTEPGKPASWLFGTLHVADERLTPLKQPVLEALRGSNVVIVEPKDVADPESGAATQTEAGRRAFRPGGRSLFAVPAEERMRVINLLAARGLIEVNAQRLELWFLAVIGTIPPCELARAEAGVKNVDLAIVEAAREKGLRLEGLETVDEQVDALASAGNDLASKVLIDTAKLGPAAGDFLETMVSLYLEGRMGLLLAGVRSGWLGGPRMISQLDYLEAVLKGRNARMAERARPFVERGGAFIAVGALHLAGDDGLVERFRRDGATVEKVM